MWRETFGCEKNEKAHSCSSERLFLKNSRENPRISDRPEQSHEKEGLEEKERRREQKKKERGETLTAC